MKVDGFWEGLKRMVLGRCSVSWDGSNVDTNAERRVLREYVNWRSDANRMFWCLGISVSRVAGLRSEWMRKSVEFFIEAEKNVSKLG